MADTKTLVQNQRGYFMQNHTKSINFRRKQLLLLKRALHHYEKDILQALHKDLNKAPFEAYATELGIVKEELSFMLRYLRKLSRPIKAKVSVSQFPASSYILKEPYGVVLIMSPWNYPFQLTLVPLIGAIAAGNCAVVKPSAYSPHTSKIIARLLHSIYPEDYVSVILGGRKANTSLLEQKFDYIFFTGGTEVGKAVMSAAARHLTPVTLELGGKSPCIVDDTANLKLAAKRIAWGKFLNAGQTCVAPDYVLVHSSIKQEFIDLLWKYVRSFYGTHPQNNPEYPRVITQKHYDRLMSLIAEEDDIRYGGNSNPDTRQIEPTLIHNAGWDSAAMREEIFGPLLPIIAYTDLEDSIYKIKERPKPLALYLFTQSDKVRSKILRQISFGGGCINDTVIHLASSSLPFGGVGASGMGSYHGAESFRTFSHQKSIVDKRTSIDIPLRYPPYHDKLKWLKLMLR
ncbi:aldehyde dehydrogenase [Luxibacter massiliensis]|uniref:aldehyde dehydrogenase n=1 Tax=Luxibacter massiliensis TaxID=2219695 RepID=UPI000F05C20F|nr:aldehyde dehydrogenase [Luxibacter massiliensis]